MRKISDALVLLLTVMAGAAQPFAPVNPHASAEGKRVLSYLYSISGKYILSGQHNYNQEMNRYSDSARFITGKYPAVWGTDFIWNGMQAKLADAQWTELTTPGTPLYNRWLAQVDKVAGYLAQLRDAHVPVLWRPYHEMNGVWFWWGDKKGPNGLARLWRNMYDRYVNHFKLDNLLWVWGANGLRDLPEDQAYSYQDYYPGADYVDVPGADVYRFDYEQSDYDALLAVAKGKLIALTEVGELPTDVVLKAQPKWAWFLVWSNFLLTGNTTQRVKDVYARPETLSHQDVKIP